jgi:hypothetical protein
VSPRALRVVRGSATPEELAALVAVVAAASRAADGGPSADGDRPKDGDPAGPGTSLWAAPARSLRGGGAADALRPGPHAWRTSSWPR